MESKRRLRTDAYTAYYWTCPKCGFHWTTGSDQLQYFPSPCLGCNHIVTKGEVLACSHQEQSYPDDNDYMNAVEAIIYCLGFISPTPEDGEIRSQVAFDKNGQPHWIAWNTVSPMFCSESPTPFASNLEPYETQKI